VWEAFWNYVPPDTVEAFPDEGYVPQADDDLPEGVAQEDVPISPKYFAGFRSLGSEAKSVRRKRPRSPRGSRTSKTRPSARAAPRRTRKT